MSATDDPEPELTTAEARELRRFVGLMMSASVEYGVPGADDAVVFTDIARSLGRDRNAVRQALAVLRDIAGGDFAGLDEARAEVVMASLLGRDGPIITALGLSRLAGVVPG
ncbi:MAG: hypothetical protein ACREFB_02955 [Stellaceae bacterium]